MNTNLNFRKITYFFGRSLLFFYENHLSSAKNANFCEFCEKKRMFSERGCHFCDFCENDARFPWVELIDFPNNSLNFHEKRTNSLKFYEKRTNSLNIHEKRTFSEKGCRFCEFCEKDARFPWVEFVDFRKIGPRT